MYLLYAGYGEAGKQTSADSLPKFDIFPTVFFMFGFGKLYQSEFWQETDGALKRRD